MCGSSVSVGTERFFIRASAHIGRQALQFRLLNLDPAAVECLYRTAFEEPALGCVAAPQSLAPRVVQLPANRLKVRVDGQIIGSIELDTMPVRIAQIQEVGVGDAMASGATLNAVGLECTRQDVAQLRNARAIR